ncbi:MAG: hypothetical protein WC054_01105 [Candidatus Nanopelagicales bacterium]
MATWTQRGNIKGPQGDQGPQGAQGIQGIQGVPGEDGAGVAIAGTVPTYADLPDDLEDTLADRGKGYLVEADGKLYVWGGTSFPADGSGVAFRGPQGPQGVQGSTGATGAQGIQGVPGNTGATGPKGDQGDQGIQGIQGVKGDTGDTGSAGVRGSQWYSDAGVPGTISGQAVGDWYLDSVTGTYYERTP